MGLKRNNLERIEINKIVISKDSIKEEDYHLFEKLKKSVESRGQLKNIVVCELENGMYECLEGAKMIRILQELNEDSVLAINMGVLSDFEKNHVRIEISRDYFLTNYVQIGLFLKELAKTARTADLCNTLPFTVRQCEHLINMSEFDWEQFNVNKQIEGQMSIFDAILEKKPLEQSDLQPWQETILDMTSTEDVKNDWVEKTNDVQEVEEDNFVFPDDLDKLHESDVVQSEPKEVEIVFDLTEDLKPKEEEVEQEVPEEKEVSKSLNYDIVDEQLVIFNHKTEILEFLPTAATKYLVDKYGEHPYEPYTIEYKEENEITIVNLVVLKSKYGTVYKLKPQNWIDYLIEEIDPLNNPFQQSLF